MFDPGIIARVQHWINGKMQRIFAKKNRIKLNNTDFTIISNNCWGGIAYEYFGLLKQSPTIGGYFFAEDYLRFITHLEDYINMEIEIISLEESRHKKEIINSGTPNAIIGRLSNDSELQPVEIIFLHYKNKNIVIDKWNRRKERINYNNLIFKFSFQNGCTKEQLEIFDKLQLSGKKIMFINKAEDLKNYSCAVYYHGFEDNSQIDNDTFYWNRYFDVIKFINTGVVVPKD